MTGDCHSTKKKVKRYYKPEFVVVVVVDVVVVVVAFIANCLAIKLPPKRKKL
jgi:hypothetical protein